MKKYLTVLLIFILCVISGCTNSRNKQNSKNQTNNENENPRITIEDSEFKVEGRRIWINGTNTPWNRWNDFGGAYDGSWWDKHFTELRKAGINASRVWINCNNGNYAIYIDEDGMVSGASDEHWLDLDDFFLTAERNQIYIMATLLSFDHFKNENDSRPEAQDWRNMLYSKEACASFAENYTIPFVKRYGKNPYLWSIDICNEPDWIYENENCGKIPWEQISYFFAVNAAAIHENSDVLVTVGLAMPKYNSDYSGYEGNKISDAFLQYLYPNKNAYMDFWSPHYYDWIGRHYGVPFKVSPYGNKPFGFGLPSSKPIPALIGECSAKGSKGDTPGTENNTIITDYEDAYKNGWQGVMAWTSNGVDANGGLSDMSAATRNMLEKYKDVIFPFGY